VIKHRGRMEVPKKATLIVAMCLCVISLGLQMSGEVGGGIGSMSCAMVAFTTSMYSFANQAIKALKQENESSQTGGTED